jgi:hypothetical protein
MKQVRVTLLMCVLAIAVGCKKKNPAVCCVSPADCSDLGIQEEERPCEDGFACIEHECTIPPDAPAAPPCEVDTDCSSSLPHCSPERVCVECLQADQCAAAEPVCEQTTHNCRACAVDDECQSSVCDASSGACVSEVNVLYASPSGSDGAPCTKTQPCSITHAFALADATRNTVKMLAGTYTASLSVAKNVVVHGYGATLNSAAGAPTFQVDYGGHLRLLGLSIVNINTPLPNGIAINCYPNNTPGTKPIVELDDVAIDATDQALMAYPCTATITRSRLKTRTSARQIVYALPTSSVTIDRSVLDGGDGVQAEGSASVVRITNTVIRNQTGPDGAFAGTNLFGQGAGSVFVSFSTAINSTVKCGSGTPRCAGGTGTGACIDNSIIYNGSSGAPTDTVQGSSCTASFSIIFPQSTPLAGGNNQLGVNPMFKDFPGADYHLSLASTAVDAADPAATNMVDLDGVQRPQGPRSDIGAFEYK